MKTYLFLGLTLSVAAGCSSSYEVGNEPAPDKYSFAQVNENAKDNSVTISTMHGDEIRATDLFVSGDSTTFLQSTTEKRITIATSSVGRITIKNAGAGAIDGLIAGAIVGVPAGWIFGSMVSALNDDVNSIDGPAAAVVFAGTAVLGAAVGGAIRHTDVYIFQPTNNNSQKEK
jgi:hypothetical protein